MGSNNQLGARIVMSNKNFEDAKAVLINMMAAIIRWFVMDNMKNIKDIVYRNL